VGDFASLWVRTVKAGQVRVDVRSVTVPGIAIAQGTGDAPAAVPSTVGLGSAGTAARSSTGRPLRAHAPQRSDELSHMTLDRLRNYRRTLLSEELRTSYWRRLLQARRDLLRSGSRPGDRTALRDALTEPRGGAGRQAILALHPAGGMPILPHLPELWATEVGTVDPDSTRELSTRLTSAESVLSSYREALHRRLDRATADLVARYHEDPRLCFSALPAVDRPTGNRRLTDGSAG
jgi:anti-sigma-K factor RsiG